MESLAVKYRPRIFDEVCSQESIVRILNRQLELNEFKNCYIFSGASGCGKTTIARIFANEINKHLGSPIEIDGASNNGVDNVKQIIASASERALDGGVYKIYIIDECHMLTTQAWNAFLKCIEEPPTYTIFIFCTTDPQKIPTTVANRCQRFNFNRIKSSVIKDRLTFICSQEGYTNYTDTCDYISRICSGQMRDGISLLEKCASYDTDLSLNNTLKALGNYSYDIYFKLINYLIDGDVKETLQVINDIYQDGGDVKLFIDQFLTFCLDICKYSLCGDYRVTSIPNSYEEEMRRASNFDNSLSYYNYVVDKLLNLKNMLKTDIRPKDTIEVMLMDIARCK